MAYRIVLRNGLWYVPQYQEGGRWLDFRSTVPGELPLAYSSLLAARTAAIEGPATAVPDQIVEEG